MVHTHLALTRTSRNQSRFNHEEHEETRRVLEVKKKNVLFLLRDLWYARISLADLYDCKVSYMSIARSTCSCGLPLRATKTGK